MLEVSASQINELNIALDVKPIADIKFSTLGLGYAYHLNPQTKLILYYDIVTNEVTQLPGYLEDLKDNILTCRLQFRF